MQMVNINYKFNCAQSVGERGYLTHIQLHLLLQLTEPLVRKRGNVRVCVYSCCEEIDLFTNFHSGGPQKQFSAENQ